MIVKSIEWLSDEGKLGCRICERSLELGKGEWDKEIEKEEIGRYLNEYIGGEENILKNVDWIDVVCFEEKRVIVGVYYIGEVEELVSVEYGWY